MASVRGVGRSALRCSETMLIEAVLCLTETYSCRHGGRIVFRFVYCYHRMATDMAGRVRRSVLLDCAQVVVDWKQLLSLRRSRADPSARRHRGKEEDNQTMSRRIVFIVNHSHQNIAHPGKSLFVGT